jgi:hypothetical protein
VLFVFDAAPGLTRLVLNVGSNAPEYRYLTMPIDAAGPVIEREWAARAASALYMIYLALGALLFFRLFAYFSRLKIFDPGSARCLLYVGLWMMGVWGAGVLFRAAKWAYLEYPGFGFDMGVGLLPGFFIFVLARVMEEAARMAEEQALTV